MKAFRNVGGNVVEIDIDIDLDGKPILPPDTTTDTRPEAQEGHYVTVVGNVWVQIPIPQQFVSFETKQAQAQAKLKQYRNWYLDQPVLHNDVKFDGDEQARARLTQAIVMFGANGYLPPAWINYENGNYPLATIEDLKGIANTVQVAFSNRFFEMNTIRGQIEAAIDEAQLDAVVIPEVPHSSTIV